MSEKSRLVGQRVDPKETERALPRVVLLILQLSDLEDLVSGEQVRQEAFYSIKTDIFGPKSFKNDISVQRFELTNNILGYITADFGNHEDSKMRSEHIDLSILTELLLDILEKEILVPHFVSISLLLSKHALEHLARGFSHDNVFLVAVELLLDFLCKLLHFVRKIP